MDAREPKPRSDRFSRPLIIRLTGACLALVLLIGLWQGYGAWLLGGIHAG